MVFLHECISHSTSISSFCSLSLLFFYYWFFMNCRLFCVRMCSRTKIPPYKIIYYSGKKLLLKLRENSVIFKNNVGMYLVLDFLIILPKRMFIESFLICQTTCQYKLKSFLLKWNLCPDVFLFHSEIDISTFRLLFIFSLIAKKDELKQGK